MALKWIGCLLILLAGGYGAWLSVRFENRKIGVLEGWVDLVFLIRQQIDCFLMPVNAILENADSTLLYSCMFREDAPTLSGILSSSSPYLGKDAYRLLHGFVREIGFSYREDQLRLCNYCAEGLQKMRDKAKEDGPMRKKVCVSLLICAALGIAILLW